MTSRAELERQVLERAGDRCEYCRRHQGLQGARFHLEHILPIARGGATDVANLAWACPGCNLRKSDRVESIDPESGETVPLFHPRTQAWGQHFDWDDYHVIRLTAIGRATVAALDMNHPRRIRIRNAEQMFGLFPPQK
jgi:hypothetical protein